MKIEIVLFVFHIFLQRNTLLHAAPSLESCPRDSILVEDTCKCNHESCSKPPCLSELKISANGTETPGECCSVYSCEGCANDTLIDGKCPCAPGAVLTANECQCIDPYKKLTNNECVCDSNLCPLPELCDTNTSVSVQVTEGCCNKIKCIKCPEDSFPTSYEDGIEDKCVCFPCNPECPEGQTPITITKGKGFPGHCCDYYECENKTCLVDGVAYIEGEKWQTRDLQVCSCLNGISFCSRSKDREEPLRCHSEGAVVYEHNESKLIDECTNCTCHNGTITCITHMCKVPESTTTKKEECQPLRCTKPCLEGYKLNKRGCKICKCNSSKYSDLLHQYNITKNELKEILDDYFAHSRNETTTTTTTSRPITNISMEHEVPAGETYGWQFIALCISLPILFGAIICLLACVIYCRVQARRGSYDTNPASSPFLERVKAKKDVLLPNYMGK